MIGAHNRSTNHTSEGLKEANGTFPMSASPYSPYILPKGAPHLPIEKLFPS